MKYAWLLSLPYVVKVSYSIPKNIPSYSVELMPLYEFNCAQDKDFCEDLAQALNDAHEKRVDESEIGTYMKNNPKVGYFGDLTIDDIRKDNKAHERTEDK